MVRRDGRLPVHRGFTLIELLVVILIILVVSAVALPTIYTAVNHRQVSEAGRILQGVLVGARDRAIHDGQPSGIRLLPDPTFFHGFVVLPDGTRLPAPLRDATGQIVSHETLAYNRIVPIDPAPEYSEGLVTVRPRFAYAANIVNVPALVLEEAPVDRNGLINPPTSWAWNVRVGDRVQLNNAGPWYVVVGPMAVGPAAGNSEMFVNWGAPGATSPLNPSGNAPLDYLLLANGIDDNNNGWIDEGWDGVDNNGNGLFDEHRPNAQPPVSEWEAEAWHGAAAAGMTSQPYTLRRRPMPSANAREVALPTAMVVDATTAMLGTRERSRLPVNPFTGVVEVMVNPDGTVSYSSPYGAPSSFGFDSAFYHFFLSERQDVIDVATTSGPNGTVVAAPIETVNNGSHFLPLGPLPVTQDATGANVAYKGAVLKGPYSILTLNARSGAIVNIDNPVFDNPIDALTANRSYNPVVPFIPAQQGVR